MAVRLTRAACPGRTRVRPLFACSRAIALLAVLAMLGVPGCASKEGAAPSSASETAPAPEATGAAQPPAATGTAPGATEPAATEAVPTEQAPPPTQPGPASPDPVPPIEPAPAATEAGKPAAGPGPRQPGRPKPGMASGKGDRNGTSRPTAPPAVPPPPPVAPPQSGDQQATTAPVPEEPAPEPDVRDDIEAFYAGLPEEAIAFHVPRAVPRGQVFTVRLIVEPGKSEAEIERVLVEMARDAGPGEVRTRTARVGDEMQALLSSPTLQIVVRGNDTQLVRRSGVTEWAWDVTATTGGKHRLALTLYAIPQGRGSGVKVKTFEETLSVEVGFVDEVKETLSANWEWMWTFVLGPIGAVVWRRRQRRLAGTP